MREFPEGMECAGTTPHLLACAFKLQEAMKYLLESGCQYGINIRSPYWLDGGHYTPLAKSILQGSKAVFKLLLEQGADAAQIHLDENWHNLVHLYLYAVARHDDAHFAEAPTRGALINQFEDTESQFETPLTCALRRRCFTPTKWLLEYGANPHTEYRAGMMIEMTYISSVLGFLLKEQTSSSLVCICWLLREVPSIGFIVSSHHSYSELHALTLNQQWVVEEQRNPAAPLVLTQFLTTSNSILSR